MEGAALAAKREYDLSIATAWHTAMFVLSGYSGGLKGKKLSDFLSSSDSKPDHRSNDARGIHFFHQLKAAGVPIEITRTKH